MLKAYIGLASTFAIAVFTGWPLFNGLRAGTIYLRRVGYSRVDDPSSFWFYVFAYAMAFAASAGLLLFIAFAFMSSV